MRAVFITKKKVGKKNKKKSTHVPGREKWGLEKKLAGLRAIVLLPGYTEM